MAHEKTLSRPYARAIFDLAKKNGQWQEWTNTLKLLAEIVTNNEMSKLLSNPTLDPLQLADFIIDIDREKFSQEAQNLVKILALGRRLRLLPTILEQYEYYRANEENILQGQCLSVIPLTKPEQDNLISLLSQELGKKVMLTYEQDAALLGGFIIRADDLLIDGSLKGKLMRLKENIGG